MIDIDFQNEKVKETINKVAKETGMSLQEIIKEYEYIERFKKYVRFKKGKYKGTVGIIYPTHDLGFVPYAVTVYCEGVAIWCPPYHTELETITKEQYDKADKRLFESEVEE